MTRSREEQLAGLVEKWRTISTGFQYTELTYKDCANELEAILSQPEPSGAPPDFKSFSQCSNVIELTAWLKENALPPYRQFALALACKLESFTPAAPAEVTAALEPFAEFGQYLLDYPRNGISDDMYGWDNQVFIRKSDLIRAAKVLAAAKGGKG